jgi:DNA repair photolyase
MNGAAGKAKFHSSVNPVPDLFARLAKDCSKPVPDPIFLSFLCDVYPANRDVHSVTRECLEIIANSGNSVNILTKGGSRAIKDFDLLAKDPRNKIGATLTFLDNAKSRHWEPKATLPDDRLHMLAAAKDAGIYTWASCEPVIEPSETLRIMYFAAPYVDEFRIGKWNHDQKAKEIDWKKFYNDAKNLMGQLGKKHMFKIDLLEAAGVKS